MMDHVALRQPDVAVDGWLILEGIDEAAADRTDEQALFDRERFGMAGEQTRAAADDHPGRDAIISDADRR